MKMQITWKKLSFPSFSWFVFRYKNQRTRYRFANWSFLPGLVFLRVLLVHPPVVVRFLHDRKDPEEKRRRARMCVRRATEIRPKGQRYADELPQNCLVTRELLRFRYSQVPRVMPRNERYFSYFYSPMPVSPFLTRFSKRARIILASGAKPHPPSRDWNVHKTTS